MKKLLKLTALLLIVISLTGCWDQNIYENIGFILNAGIDKGTDDKILFTVSTPIISESSGGVGGGSSSAGGGEGQKVEVYSSETNLIRQERENLRLSSPKQLEGGKIQNVLFGSELAREKGISEYLELYERDTQSTVQSWIVVVDGTANELITKGANMNSKPRLGQYLNDLLERNSKAGYCPKMNIIKYSIENVIPGLSPILPMIKLEPNDIKVIGTALINNNKMSGRLDTLETAYLFIAKGESKMSEIPFDLPEDIKTIKKKAIVFLHKTKTKSKLNFTNGTPTLDFNIKIDVTMEEYTWGQLADKKYKTKIEEALASHIKNSLNEVFKKLQAANCDPLGIGDRLRAYHNSYWKSIGELDGWKKIYPNITANFNVTTNITRYGSIL